MTETLPPWETVLRRTWAAEAERLGLRPIAAWLKWAARADHLASREIHGPPPPPEEPTE